MRTSAQLTLYEREIDYIEEVGICGPRLIPIPESSLDPTLVVDQPIYRNYSGTFTRGSPDHIIKLYSILTGTPVEIVKDKINRANDAYRKRNGNLYGNSMN